MSANAVYLLETLYISDSDPRFAGFRTDESQPWSIPERFGEDWAFDPPPVNRSIRWRPRRLRDVWEPWPVKPERRRILPSADFVPIDFFMYRAFSGRAVKALGPLLSDNGEVLPLRTDQGRWYFFNPLTVIDALDHSGSIIGRSRPDEIGWVEYYAIRPETLCGAAIFRIPEQPYDLLVTEEFRRRCEEAGLQGMDFIKVWPLPKGTDFEREHEKVLKARRRQAPDRQSLVILLGLRGQRPTQTERRQAERLVQALEEKLDVESASDPYYGSVETTEFARGEFRIFCTCPDADKLADFLYESLVRADWDGEIEVIKRYGDLYTRGVKVSCVSVKSGAAAAAPSQSRRRTRRRSEKTGRLEEVPLDEQQPILAELIEASRAVRRRLRITSRTSPKKVVAKVDEEVYHWQQSGEHPFGSDSEACMGLAYLWGEALVRSLKWHWALVKAAGAPDEEGRLAVVSPDRAFAIYPVEFIEECVETGRDVTILLSFNMLHTPDRLPEARPDAFLNIMDRIHRIVPRL